MTPTKDDNGKQWWYMGVWECVCLNNLCVHTFQTNPYWPSVAGVRPTGLGSYPL